MATRLPFLNWQFAGVVTVAVVIFVLTLFGLSRYVDQSALDRERTQLRSGLDVEVREIARRIAPIADWDDAVLHLDRTFDRAWAIKNIGEYFVQNDSLPISCILDGNDRIALAMRSGLAAAPAMYRPLVSSAEALVTAVRDQERKRGVLRPPFRTSGTVSWPIQVEGIESVDGAPFVVVASLVQPDNGRALPRGSRAPILLNAQPMDDAFLAPISERLLIENLHYAPRSRAEASMAVYDHAGRAVGFLSWEPWRPGAELIFFAFLPILAGVAIPLGLYMRSRAITGQLAGALRELSEARDHADVALQAARESDAAKSQFLANMSHELRTPLNAIMGFSEMLKSESFRHATVEYADIIHRSAHFLLSLINDILDLSKIDAGKLELVESDVDIRTLAQDCMAMMGPKGEARQLVMRNDIPEALPKLRGDPRYLRQILLNLLSNAAKFTGPGGEIVIGAQVLESGEMLCTVSDTGCGIPREDQPRVFEQFGQGRHDVVERDKGTGLGLPIVRGLTEAHGGRVMLESARGEGTRVTLVFPNERVLRGVHKRAA